MKPVVLILILAHLPCAPLHAAAASPAVGEASSPGIVLSGNGPAVAGSNWTVKVTPTAGEASIAATATVGGHRVTPTVMPLPDGTYEVVVPIPAGCGGDTVCVTVVGGACVKKLTGVVQTQP